jgi:hypothetical protein
MHVAGYLIFDSGVRVEVAVWALCLAKRHVKIQPNTAVIRRRVVIDRRQIRHYFPVTLRISEKATMESRVQIRHHPDPLDPVEALVVDQLLPEPVLQLPAVEWPRLPVLPSVPTHRVQVER